jgi:PadR family transcriptional regulator, regulatory protein PadR
VRKTQATVQVALALMADPQGQHWGYQLSKTSGLRSGVLYPIVHRMLDEGWLADGWEPSRSGRPPRRYYEITTDGLRELGALLARAENDVRFSALRRRFA